MRTAPSWGGGLEGETQNKGGKFHPGKALGEPSLDQVLVFGCSCLVEIWFWFWFWFLVFGFCFWVLIFGVFLVCFWCNYPSETDNSLTL